MNEIDINDIDGDDYPMVNSSLISDCCGAPSLGETDNYEGKCISGLCSECLCQTTFKQKIENERKH